MSKSPTHRTPDRRKRSASSNVRPCGPGQPAGRPHGHLGIPRRPCALARGLAAFLGVFLFGLVDTAEARRLALVIGNDSYAASGSNLSTLQQARSDARGVSGALRDVGFEVETVEDADLGELQDAFQRFRGRLEAAPGEVALIYFAGHGLQHTSADAQDQTVQQPWLLPVDARLERLWDIESRGVPLGRVRSLLANSGFKASVIVLDMCRNEVFAGGAPPTGLRGSWVRGLAPVSASGGLLVAYATAAGDVAREVPGQANSLYASAVIEQLRVPGQHLYDIFNNAALAVARGGLQKPELMVSALEPVYLSPRTGPGPVPVPRDAPAVFTADAECTLSVNGQQVSTLQAGVPFRGPLAIGANVITCTSVAEPSAVFEARPLADGTKQQVIDIGIAGRIESVRLQRQR